MIGIGTQFMADQNMHVDQRDAATVSHLFNPMLCCCQTADSLNGSDMQRVHYALSGVLQNHGSSGSNSTSKPDHTACSLFALVGGTEHAIFSHSGYVPVGTWHNEMSCVAALSIDWSVAAVEASTGSRCI